MEEFNLIANFLFFYVNDNGFSIIAVRSLSSAILTPDISNVEYGHSEREFYNLNLNN